MGKYLDLVRKRVGGTTDTTEHDQWGLPGASVVFGRIGRILKGLERRCPNHVPLDRWDQAIVDGWRFLATWGEKAEALGWSNTELFGLHTPPEKPHASYRRLSRYDETGLIWLLEGSEVLALTANTATIRRPSGSTTTYRKHNKPALGALGDSLDDLQ
jgi:hypothetical protein